MRVYLWIILGISLCLNVYYLLILSKAENSPNITKTSPGYSTLIPHSRSANTQIQASGKNFPDPLMDDNYGDVPDGFVRVPIPRLFGNRLFKADGSMSKYIVGEFFDLDPATATEVDQRLRATVEDLLSLELASDIGHIGPPTTKYTIPSLASEVSNMLDATLKQISPFMGEKKAKQCVALFALSLPIVTSTRGYEITVVKFDNLDLWTVWPKGSENFERGYTYQVKTDTPPDPNEDFYKRYNRLVDLHYE